MIKRAERENIDEIKRLWKVCFPDVDERYQDFFFKNVVRPEDCYIKVLEGKIVATLVRNKHALMFNSRVLQASMIMGVAVHPEYRHRGYMHEMMDIIVDACEHSELLTLIQTEKEKKKSPLRPSSFQTLSSILPTEPTAHRSTRRRRESLHLFNSTDELGQMFLAESRNHRRQNQSGCECRDFNNRISLRTSSRILDFRRLVHDFHRL